MWFYRCYTPALVALPVLVRVAGTRWRVEESFQTGKGVAGLDQHQVRRWHSWYRWTVMAMLAHAFLTVVAATERTRGAASTCWISLTCNEVQHLFATLVITPIKDITYRLRFSVCRRRHQHRARQAHYQRQTTARTMTITIYGWSTRSRRRSSASPRRARAKSKPRGQPQSTRSATGSTHAVDDRRGDRAAGRRTRRSPGKYSSPRGPRTRPRSTGNSASRSPTSPIVKKVVAETSATTVCQSLCPRWGLAR
jgi:hypothetical protein